MEEYSDLEERLRDVEVFKGSVSSTLQSMSNDVVELKAMVQKILTYDAAKISELTQKVDTLSSMQNSQDSLFKRFIVLESQHERCQLSDTTKTSKIDQLEAKVSTLELLMTSISTSKGKYEGFLFDIGKQVAIVGILYLLFIISQYVSKDDLPTPPKFKSKATISIPNSEAYAYQNISSTRKVIKWK